jgi:predicted kinase
VVCGLPGSGKSTLAEDIAKKLRTAIFSVDPIESAMLKTGLKRGFKTGYAAYLVAEALAAEHFKLGQSVVIDCVSAQEVAKDMWRTLSKKYKAKLVVIECECSDQTLHKQRIEARVRGMHGIAEVTWQDVQDRRKEYTEWKEPHLILDTADDHQQNLAKALGYLKEQVQ